MGKIWQQAELKLTKEFSEGNFEKLLEYVEQNELNLRELLSSQDSVTIIKSLEFATGLLRYFGASLEADPKTFSAFKLGELFGYVECLNHLENEHLSNSLALQAFYVAKSHMLFSEESQLVKLLFIISDNECVTKTFLESANPSMSKPEIDYSLEVFERFAIINHYYNPQEPIYSLTDAGRRIVKHFKRLTSDN